MAVTDATEPATDHVVAFLALIPVATEAPALVALAGVAAICVGLIAYEVTAYRGARARVRAAHS